MKLLVTGGAGFIGSNFIRYHGKTHPEDEIVNLDALTYASQPLALKELKEQPGYRFVKGDIADRSFVMGLFEEERFDVVVNFAAESHVDRAIRQPDVFVRTNVLGTQVLLDAAKEYGVKRYHQISTDEVYGALPLDRPELLFHEESALAPSNPYSASKAAADLLVMSYFKTFGLPVTISRCSNNYGPYQHEEKLIPHMIGKARNGELLPVYGDGKNVRDWIYVEDHCSAVECILERGTVGELYNIGAQGELSNIALVRRILSILDKPETLISYVADRPGHDLRYGMDATKLRTELGWEPKYSLNEGLEKTVAWYQKNGEN